MSKHNLVLSKRELTQENAIHSLRKVLVHADIEEEYDLFNVSNKDQRDQKNIFSLIDFNKKWDNIFLERGMLSLRGCWSIQFLHFLSSLLKQGGSIWLPYSSEKLGQLSYEDYQEYFENVQRLDDLSYCQVSKVKNGKKSFSIFNFYKNNRRQLGVYEKRAISAHEHSYFLFSLEQKISQMPFILNHFKASASKHLDIGGGYGYLSANLLSEALFHCEESTVIDCNASSKSHFDMLKKEMSLDFDKKFNFIFSKVEDFLFQKKFNLITAFASLLYVDRIQLNQVFQKIWNALDSGGLLILHEYMKRESFTKDYSRMFTQKELDNYLSAWGEVTYFDYRYFVKYKDLKATKGANVFRVLKKH